MKNPNLVSSALFSVALIGGIAWYGEITHGTVPPIVRTVLVDTFGTPPPPEDPDPPVDVSEPDTKQVRSEVPQIADIATQTPPIGAITQAVEPPPPIADTTGISVIPQIRAGDVGRVGAIDLSQVDQAPVARYQARPEYPYEMRREMISGEVLVDFVVDAQGNVRNAYAAHSSQKDFEAAAERAVSQWKFKPGRKGGRAVAVHMQIPIVFTLSEDR